MATFVEGLFAAKIALVTGGGSGISRRIAERIAEHGAIVGVIGRTQARLADTVKSIRQAGGRAVAYVADVREYEALEQVAEAVRVEYGPIDIVVCGAAGNFPAAAASMSANAFKSVVDIDLLGTFNTCRACYPHLKKPGASIVNISAPQATQPLALQSHVSAAKAGVDMLTRTLAVEWGKDGVRVNAVVPGGVEETEGMDRLAPVGPIRDAFVRRIPLGRLATKDDIADLVTFLCSDAARYVTGSVMVCDGGLAVAGAMYGLSSR